MRFTLSAASLRESISTMSQGRPAKLTTKEGRQSVELPIEWHFHGEEVYLWRDHKTCNVVMSSFRSIKGESLSERLIKDLVKGWFAFSVLVILTVLSEKLVHRLGENQSLNRYGEVAYWFDFGMFILYNFIKAYEFVRPPLHQHEEEVLSSSNVTWVSFARLTALAFFVPFAKMIRPRSQASLAVESELDEEVLIALVVMLRTAMTDEDIRKLFRSKGYPDNLIELLLKKE